MPEPNGEGIHVATDDPARQANRPETEAATRPEGPALAEVRERAQRAIADVETITGAATELAASLRQAATVYELVELEAQRAAAVVKRAGPGGGRAPFLTPILQG